MSNTDIAEIRLLKKRQNYAESRAKQLKIRREIQKRRERMMTSWIIESEIEADEKLTDLFIKEHLKEKLKG